MNKFHRIHLTASDLLGHVQRLGMSDRKRLLDAGATNLGPFEKSLRALFVAAGRLGSASAAAAKEPANPEPEPEEEDKVEAKNLGTAPENKDMGSAPEDKGE